MPECPRHSWRFLKTTAVYATPGGATRPLTLEKQIIATSDLFYCIHCLAYATRAEILNMQEPS